VTLFATQTLWFVVPIALTWTGSLSLPQTRYSSGILAIMHSAQYLWITQHYARRDAALRDAARETTPVWSGLRYWSTLIVGGIALFVPGPWLASYAGHVDFTSSMLIVTALVNIHHFMLDGVVWKLRDARVATVLVQPAGAEAVAPPTPLSSSSATAARGRGWPAWSWKAIRVAAVCGLVSLAAVDQWRYRLSVRESDPAALGAAQRLNPWDNPVYLRLAAAGVAASAGGGDRDAAVRELERAIEAHQDSPAPYQALSRILIEAGRLDDAYAVTRGALVRSPNHIDSLVNAGVLASRLGHAEEAEQWWRRALQQNPELVDVELYLAELLDAARPQDALPHYQRHLELVAQRRDAAKASPQRVALVVVKFGDALARTGQRDLALSQYDLAERIAVRTGLTDVAALARDHRREAGR
jgi:Tfp pilus assembly protein PilF